MSPPHQKNLRGGEILHIQMVKVINTTEQEFNKINKKADFYFYSFLMHFLTMGLLLDVVDYKKLDKTV